MQSTKVIVGVDQSVLAVGDHHTVAYAVIGSERTGARPPRGSDEDCAIHLATSADWRQPVSIQVEIGASPAAETLAAPDDIWQLDGQGLVPFRTMPLQAMTGLEDPAGIDLDLSLPPGIYRYSAWVRGRDENRAFLEAWLDTMTADDLTAPPALEEWLIQLALTDQHDPRPAPIPQFTPDEIVDLIRARRAAGLGY